MLLKMSANGNEYTAINCFFALVTPVLLAYTLFMNLFGNKIADMLLKRDTYDNKNIRARLYGIVETCIVGILIAAAVFYSLFWKIWNMTALWSVVLLGYGWIKFDTYRMFIRYTNKYIVIQRGKKQQKVSFDSVEKIVWVDVRRSLAYALVIHCHSGMTIRLLSTQFIGLRKLKLTYDHHRQKALREQGRGDSFA